MWSLANANVNIYPVLASFNFLRKQSMCITVHKLIKKDCIANPNCSIKIRFKKAVVGYKECCKSAKESLARNRFNRQAWSEGY